jgi:hypothetical protein
VDTNVPVCKDVKIVLGYIRCLSKQPEFTLKCCYTPLLPLTHNTAIYFFPTHIALSGFPSTRWIGGVWGWQGAAIDNGWLAR